MAIALDRDQFVLNDELLMSQVVWQEAFTGDKERGQE